MPDMVSVSTRGDPDRISRIVFNLCLDLRGNGLSAPDELLRTALWRMTAELEFDEGYFLRRDPGGRLVSLRAGAGPAIDPTVGDLLTWASIRRAMRDTGAFLAGVTKGSSELPSDDRRQLWARSIGCVACVPLSAREQDAGMLLLCSRRASRAWDPLWLASLRTLAEAALPVFGAVAPKPDDRTISADDFVTPPTPLPDLEHRPPNLATDDDIVGESTAWRYVMFRVDQVAATHATVMIMGDTGTGKELVAQAIHRRSARSSARFVALNCAALPATLMESELFGRERGAFTGAHASQAGRFELAHRGTMFLDEIADLSLELQPKLLRVLQEGQLDRLGSSRTVEVDVRVIAATNRDLTEEVRQGRFRQDLFYRLNVFPITLPSLRERREDIPLLVWHMATRFARSLRKTIDRIPADVMQALQAHDWPGNIRELENVIQRAIIVSNNGVLSLNEVSLPPPPPATLPTGTNLMAVQREHILRVLGSTGWRIEGSRGAAHLLGLKPSTLRSRLRKLGIERHAPQL